MTQISKEDFVEVQIPRPLAERWATGSFDKRKDIDALRFWCSASIDLNIMGLNTFNRWVRKWVNQ